MVLLAMSIYVYSLRSKFDPKVCTNVADELCICTGLRPEAMVEVSFIRTLTLTS